MVKNKKISKNNSMNKDIIAEIEEKFKRHTGVLMEQMEKEVRTVAEGHSSIMRKLNEHDERFEKIESDVGSLQSEVGSVKLELQYVKAAVMDTSQTVKSIEKKLDNHETRISKLEEKVLVNE